MVDWTYNPKATCEKAIIVDLDETLVHSFNYPVELLDVLGVFSDVELRARIYTIPLYDVDAPRGTGEVDTMWGVLRPGAMEFIAFCCNNFKFVGVWSAGRHQYVHHIARILFSGTKRPNMIYTYDNCEEDTDRYIVKPLEKIYGMTHKDFTLSESNTLIIDDRDHTFRKNPGNAIHIPPYEPEPTLESMKASDPTLYQLTEWLSSPEISWSNDVRRLPKQGIFQ